MATVSFVKTRRIPLSPEAFERLIDLMNHPELFEKANQRLHSHKSKIKYLNQEELSIQQQKKQTGNF